MTDSVSLEHQVRSAYAAWDATFNKADPKAVAALYVDFAIFLPASHDVIRGPAEVERFFAGLFANGVSGHKLELIDAQGNGDLVVGAAKWSAKVKGTDGTTQDINGIATHIFQRQAGGTLKLKLHTFN